MIRALAAIFLGAIFGSAQAAPFAYVAQSGHASVTVIDTASNVAIASVRVGDGPFGVAVSPSGSRVYVANIYDDTVSVIDTATNNVVATVPVGEGPHGVAVNPAGTLVYVTNSGLQSPGNSVSVIEAATNTVIATLRVGGAPVGVVAHPDGTRIYVGNHVDDTVSVIDTATHEVVATLSVPGPSGIALSPRGDRLYVASATSPTIFGRMVSVIDTDSGSVVATVDVGPNPIGLAVSPSGDRVYVGNTGTQERPGDTVSIIDSTSNAVVATVHVGEIPQGISVHPSGDRVYVTNLASDSVSIVDAASASVVATIEVSGPTSFGNFVGPPSTVLVDTPGELTGLWFNPEESGWGITFVQRRNIVFAAWFTYDGAGNPKWYVAPSCTISNIACPGCRLGFSGPLYEAHGPAFFGTRYEPAAVEIATVGTVQVEFPTEDYLSRRHDEATMRYTVSGAGRSVNLHRDYFATGTAPPATNFTDLWWNPAESGWGLAVTHQFGVMFLAWYVYDSAGRPVWYVASNCAVNAGGSGCSGTLYRTTGPPLGPSFDPSQVRVFEAGTVTLSFSDDHNGLLSYSMAGVNASKTIKRQTF